MSASHLRVAILRASGVDSLQLLADQWLSANIATEVVSMDLAAGDSGRGEGLHLLIVYTDERRVRRE